MGQYLCPYPSENQIDQKTQLRRICGYHLATVLLLSVFTGTFGLARFVHLDYYGIGLLKVSTLGSFFIGQLVDIILIALQFERPAIIIIPYY
uniref:TM2 domain-containing protein n=1 Tax=Glossina austeni TaxID=7395 RepID=A0A1A9VIU8_GLOAU